MKSHTDFYYHKVNNLKKLMNNTKVFNFAAFTSQEIKLNIKYFS